MHAAILVMTEKRFGCVGVVDAGGRLVGIFTDGDLRRKLDRMLLDKPIDSVMVASPKVVAPGCAGGGSGEDDGGAQDSDCLPR